MNLDGDQKQVLAGKRFKELSAVDGWLYGIEMVAEWGHDAPFISHAASYTDNQDGDEDKIILKQG